MDIFQYYTLSDLKKSNIRQKRSRAAPDSVSACLVTRAIEARSGTTHQTGRLIPRAAEPQTRGGDRRKGATSFLSPLNKKKIEARTNRQGRHQIEPRKEKGERSDRTKREVRRGFREAGGGGLSFLTVRFTRQGGGGALMLGAPPCRP